MKAMILAAGQGTRMRPLTYELPKPMIPILGKPVMEYLVEELAKHGFNEIMINVSHHAFKIEQYFGDGRRWGVHIGYSFEGHIDNGDVVAEPIGSAGGLRRIHEYSGFFDDTFLVVCGDALIDLDLTSAVRKHWQSGSKASIIVKHVPKDMVSNYGIVVCDDNGKIESFQEKPSSEDAKSDLANTGIYIFEPEIIDLIPKGQAFDIGSELFPLLLENNIPFHAIDLPFTWIDLGRLSDYWQATQRMMLGEFKHFLMPGKEVKKGIWTGLNIDIDWDHVNIEGPVYIGAGCKIEAGVEIKGPAWIGNGCVLKKGAKVSRSILFEHTMIGGSGRVEDAVVYGRRFVDKEGNLIRNGDQEIDWVHDARDINARRLLS